MTIRSRSVCGCAGAAEARLAAPADSQSVNTLTRAPSLSPASGSNTGLPTPRVQFTTQDTSFLLNLACFQLSGSDAGATKKNTTTS